MTTAEPEGASTYSGLELQGVSSDAGKAIFVVQANLTADTHGLANSTLRLYDFSGGQLHYVCVLPDGTPVTHECSAGDNESELSAPLSARGRVNGLIGAMSQDGSRVFFSTDGRLYVRENPEQAQSVVSGGKCSEKEKACTVAVSEKVSSGGSRFWAASADGSRVLFTMNNKELYEYSVTKNKVASIAGGVLGVMGASEDATRAYFVSTEALAGSAVNGKPNLYFHEAGNPTPTFIATLSSADVAFATSTLATLSPEPYKRGSRVTPDGLHLTFMSNSRELSERVAGYDNTDQSTGEEDEEVYRYGDGRLACVSCNPTGARPQGREIEIGSRKQLDTAARIPTWESDLYGSRVLSDDGSRLFFESFEALVSRDTNGKQDVYEWEMAESAAVCEAKGAEVYVAASGGCISLISSGEGAQDSEFVDASPSGDDVFFTTGASLVPQDHGLIDIYDARVDGGFPAPVAGAVCEGEACQNPPVLPAGVTPGSFTFSGPGNLVSALPITGVVSVKSKTKVLTRAQQLAKALKACRVRSKKKRSVCEAQARKKYGSKGKSAVALNRKGKASGRKGGK